MSSTAVATRTPLLRPTVAAWAILASLCISFVAVIVSADGASSLAGRVGGDFPAFYGAGSIVAAGDFDELYVPDRQAEAQRELFEGEPGVLYFAYPPPVAAAYSVLARLPYVPAYTIHTLLMVAAVVGAYWVIRPMLPVNRPSGSVVAAVAFTFVPLFMAVTLGQNTALVILLVAASWRLDRDGRPGAAGLALGMLLFKPQYAVPLIALHVLRRRWRLVGVSALTGAAWWLLGVGMLGTSWVGDWAGQVKDFTTLDAEVNGANAVSFLGVSEHLFGVSSVTALALGGISATVTAGVLALMWRRPPGQTLALPIAAVGAGLLLISPHAMFYDGGLLVLAVAGMAASRCAIPSTAVAVGWLLGALHPFKDAIGLTPVAVVVLGAFIVVVLAWRRRVESADTNRASARSRAGST